MSGDPERDDPNARPNAPAGVLSGPGKRPESAPVETGGRVPKSVFAHTIAGIPGSAALPAPAEAGKLNVPRSNSDAAEPLRDPSERPAPAPYKRAHVAAGATLPMPDAVAPGNRSSDRMIAAKPGLAGARQDSGAVQVHGAAKVGTPPSGGRGEPTVRMPTTAATALAQSARPPAKSPMPAAPPPSGAPPAMPAASKPAPQSPVPAPAAKRDEPSIPRLALGVEKIPAQEPATKFDLTGQSQPLQLSLDARDHVEASMRPAGTAPKSMLPWIALVLLVVLGGAALLMTRGGEKADAPAAERVEAVPATEPAQPSAAAPTVQGAEGVPPTTPAAPTTPTSPAVTAPAPTPAPAVPAAKAGGEVEEKQEAKATTKRKARKAKKPPAKASGPVLKVTPEGESDLEAAMRAAERLDEPEAEELSPPEPPSAEPPSPDEE